VWAYDQEGDFVGRIEINRAGIEPFVGGKGTTSLGNLIWETVKGSLGISYPPSSLR
jgi:hypothetical protein